MKKKKNKDVKEPDWLDPKNDRKTPYTEKELDIFVDGLIDNMKDVECINRALDEEGLLETRRILKEAFRKMDPYYTKMANQNIECCLYFMQMHSHDISPLVIYRKTSLCIVSEPRSVGVKSCRLRKPDLHPKYIITMPYSGSQKSALVV